MSRRLTYLTIALVGLVLLILLAALTVQRLSRTESLWRESLAKQGLFILGSLEASSRAGMRMMRNMPLRRLQFMAEELGQVGLVVSVFILDEKGRVLIHSDPDKVGLVSADTEAYWSHGSPVWAGFAENSFVVIRRFESRPGRGRMGWDHHGEKEEGPRLGVVHLPVDEYRAARRAEMYQAVGLGSAIFIGGLALIIVLLFFHDRRQLNRLQKKTDHLVDHMPAGLLSADAKGRLMTTNLSARRMLDGAPGERSGALLKDHLPAGVCRRLTGLAPDEALTEIRSELKSPAGDIPVSLSAVRLEPTADDPTALIVLLRDLSEVRELEEQLKRSERLAALGRLSAGVAHEIRNPLSSIRGLAQYLKGKMAPESDEAGYAQVMIGEADRLNRVVSDLLAYARPRPPQLVPADLAATCRRVLDLASSRAGEQQVELDLEIRTDPGPIPLDTDQVTQVILNLILNAMDAGARRVECSLDVVDNRAVLLVTDDGPGLDPEDRDKIFDPFFTTKAQGSGLGLAISLRIVEEHGGSLTLRDSERGAVFRMALPLTENGNKNV